MSDLTNSKFWNEAQHHTINEGVNVRALVWDGHAISIRPVPVFFCACNKRSCHLITEEIMGVDLFHISDIYIYIDILYTSNYMHVHAKMQRCKPTAINHPQFHQKWVP